MFAKGFETASQGFWLQLRCKTFLCGCEPNFSIPGQILEDGVTTTGMWRNMRFFISYGLWSIPVGVTDHVDEQCNMDQRVPVIVLWIKSLNQTTVSKSTYRQYKYPCEYCTTFSAICKKMRKKKPGNVHKTFLPRVINRLVSWTKLTCTFGVWSHIKNWWSLAKTFESYRGAQLRYRQTGR